MKTDLLVFVQSVKQKMQKFGSTELVEICHPTIAAGVAGEVWIADGFLQRTIVESLRPFDLHHGTISVHGSALIPAKKRQIFDVEWSKVKQVRGCDLCSVLDTAGHGEP